MYSSGGFRSDIPTKSKAYQRGKMSKKRIKRGFSQYSGNRNLPISLKFIDSSLSATGVDDGWTFLDGHDDSNCNLLLIPAGDGEGKRSDRHVTVKQIHIAGFVRTALQSSGTESTLFPQQYVRLVLLVDHNCKGDTTINANEIYETGTFNSFRNLANSTRFTVLKEKIVKISQPAINTGQAGTDVTHVLAGVQYFKMHIKCTVPIQYTGDSGITSTRAVNNILFLACSTNDNGTYTDRTTVEYRARVRYISA